MADDDDRSENLDDDRVGDSEEYPPERPLGAEDYGVTLQEQRVEEPIEERVLREEPETDVDADAGTDEPSEGPPASRTASERVPPPAEESALRVERDTET